MHNLVWFKVILKEIKISRKQSVKNMPAPQAEPFLLKNNPINIIRVSGL